MVTDLHDTVGLIILHANESIEKAWEALSGYKFWMFGYHAAAWVRYNQLLPPNERRKNPFIDAVKLARSKIEVED